MHQDRFDVDKDGLLNFAELRALGQATGGDLAPPTYGVRAIESDASLLRAHRFRAVLARRRPSVRR